MLTAKEYFLKRSPDGHTIPPYFALSSDQYDELVKESRKQGYTEAAEIVPFVVCKDAILNARDQIK